MAAAPKRTKEHPGFKAVQSEIAAKQGVSKERAGAILAAGARKASPAAIKKNPRLKRVLKPPAGKGAAKGGAKGSASKK